MRIGAALLALVFAAIPAAADVTTECQAAYQAVFGTDVGKHRVVFGGNRMAAQRPGEFRVRLTCSGVNRVRCRRRAARQAQSCMRAHFESFERTNQPRFPGSPPVLDRPGAACNPPVRGYIVTSLFEELGHAVCLTVAGDPLLRLEARDVRTVELSARTHGGRGCSGSGIGRTRTIVLNPRVVVDCPFFAARMGRRWLEMEHFMGLVLDRPGGDISGAGFPPQNGRDCQFLCADTPGCRSWTFVRTPERIPGVSPERPCFLKSTIPYARFDTCCISGHGRFEIERRTDRPGGDLPGMPLAVGHRFDCQTRCEGNSDCRAWTFVEQSRQCWLKGSRPAAVANNCCSSGVK